MSLREKLLALAGDLKTEAVDLAALGHPDLGIVTIGEMSGEMRDALVSIAWDDAGNAVHGAFAIGLLIACCRDPETSRPLFTVADADAIRALPWRVIDALAEPAKRLNGFGARVVEEAAKNSEGAPSAEPGSN